MIQLISHVLLHVTPPKIITLFQDHSLQVLITGTFRCDMKFNADYVYGYFCEEQLTDLSSVFISIHASYL